MLRQIAIFALIAFLCGGCAISRGRAIEIAKREISKRNLSLPKHYVIAIHEIRSFDNDPTPDYWAVLFASRDAEIPLYDVAVREYGGHIENFIDHSKRSSGAKPKT